jgi:hypothetical protein
MNRFFKMGEIKEPLPMFLLHTKEYPSYCHTLLSWIFCCEELDKFETILTMCNRKFGMPT